MSDSPEQSRQTVVRWDGSLDKKVFRALLQALPNVRSIGKRNLAFYVSVDVDEEAAHRIQSLWTRMKQKGTCPWPRRFYGVPLIVVDGAPSGTILLSRQDETKVQDGIPTSLFPERSVVLDVIPHG